MEHAGTTASHGNHLVRLYVQKTEETDGEVQTKGNKAIRKTNKKKTVVLQFNAGRFQLQCEHPDKNSKKFVQKENGYKIFHI